MKERRNEEKKKRPDPITSAYIILASSLGGLPPDKEYRLFRAMDGLISKENTFKLDQSEIELVSSILLLAAEIKRTNE